VLNLPAGVLRAKAKAQKPEAGSPKPDTASAEVRALAQAIRWRKLYSAAAMARSRALLLTLFLIPLAAVLPSAQTRPPSAAPVEVAAGRKIFDAQCAWCHGAGGTGGTGPSLQGTLRHATDLKSIVGIISNGIQGTEMPAFGGPLTDRAVGQTAAYVASLGRSAPRPLPGHADRGAAIYQDTGCGTCHVVAGRGGVLGPELTSIGARRGAGYLREALINPEATHPPGYLVVRAETNDGQPIRGVRLNEDVFWIHLRDAAGTVHVLEKSKLTRLERELTATLMPSYASRLTDAQLDDVVAYLATLRGAK